MTFPPKAAFCWGCLNPCCSLIRKGKWWWEVTVGKADGEGLDFLQALLFWSTPRTVVNKSETWFPPSAAGLWQNIRGSWVVSTENIAQHVPLPRRNGTQKGSSKSDSESRGCGVGTSSPRQKEPVSQAAEGWWALGGADELINAWSGSKLWSLCQASQEGN